MQLILAFGDIQLELDDLLQFIYVLAHEFFYDMTFD